MIRSLDNAGMKRLADAIGDSPWTVTSCHNLRRAQCRAWTLGPAEAFSAAVVQWDEQPTEPEGYGDPAGIWRILQGVAGWTCVDVDGALAEPLADLMAAEFGRRGRLYRDIHHVLREPVRRFQHAAVRLYGREDIDFVTRALPDELGRPESFVRNVDWSIYAAAVADGKIVAYARVSSEAGGFANIGVETCAAFRNRGYSTACASLAAAAVQQLSQTPVWSAGEENGPSLRVAAKLGFEQIGWKVYVNHPAAKEWEA